MIMLKGQPQDEDTPEFSSLEELNRHLAEISHVRNTTGDPEMGGLSPAQVSHLLYTEWGQPDAAVQLNVDLSLATLEASSFFRRTRALLLSVQEAGGVKMTSSKNFPRRFVSEMVDLLLDEKERESVWFLNKVLNEQDVHALHIPRVVAQAAGVLRCYKGKFIVPKKVGRLLQPDCGGVLYRDLFTAFFRRFNLAYLLRYGPEAEALQSGIAYTLYRLGIVASKWRKVVDLTDEITLPGVRMQVEDEVGTSFMWAIGGLVNCRILRPLIEWNLLEGRYETDKYDCETLEAVRVTPLYQSFLRFVLGDRAPRPKS